MTNTSLIAPPAARRSRCTVGQAAVWVAGLVWGLPLAGFGVAAVLNPGTGCDVSANAGMPCDQQGAIILLGFLSFVVLVPLGLLALVLVPVLGARWRPPALVLALASTAAAVVVGAALVTLLQAVG
jgi:hypothetical protein